MTLTASPLYIGGEWRQGEGPAVDVVDPATEDVVASISTAGRADVDIALRAAADGFEVWRNTDAWTRSRVLRKAADLLRERVDSIANVMTTEQGKPLAEAAGEVRASADQFDWFADEARRIYGRTIDGHSRDVRLYTIRQPIGPVAAFTAWTYPALLRARKMAAALAAGCSIIVKPAKEAPQTALELARALHDAGLPAGVLSVVLGDSGSLSAQLIGS